MSQEEWDSRAKVEVSLMGMAVGTRGAVLGWAWLFQEQERWERLVAQEEAPEGARRRIEEEAKKGELLRLQCARGCGAGSRDTGGRN